jgi:hypothetical protein
MNLPNPQNFFTISSLFLFILSSSFLSCLFLRRKQEFAIIHIKISYIKHVKEFHKNTHLNCNPEDTKLISVAIRALPIANVDLLVRKLTIFFLSILKLKT